MVIDELCALQSYSNSPVILQGTYYLRMSSTIRAPNLTVSLARRTISSAWILPFHVYPEVVWTSGLNLRMRRNGEEHTHSFLQDFDHLFNSFVSHRCLIARSPYQAYGLPRRGRDSLPTKDRKSPH